MTKFRQTTAAFGCCVQPYIRSCRYVWRCSDAPPARLRYRRTCCSPQNSRSDNSAHHHCSSAGKVTRSSAMQRHRRSISFMIAQYTAAASMRAGLRMVSACRCNAWGSTDQLSAISAWYCCHALVCLVIFSAAFPQNPAFVKPSYHIPHRTAISEPTSALFSREDGCASQYAPVSAN